MLVENRKATMLVIALLCVSVISMSTTAAAGSYSLSAAAENTTVGGSRCSSFLNGFAVGMGAAAFLGCVWCGGVAIASKAVELFAC